MPDVKMICHLPEKLYEMLGTVARRDTYIAEALGEHFITVKSTILKLRQYVPISVIRELCVATERLTRSECLELFRSGDSLRRIVAKEHWALLDDIHTVLSLHVIAREYAVNPMFVDSLLIQVPHDQASKD